MNGSHIIYILVMALKVKLRNFRSSTSFNPFQSSNHQQLTSSKLNYLWWPHQHYMTDTDLIKAGSWFGPGWADSRSQENSPSIRGAGAMYTWSTSTSLPQSPVEFSSLPSQSTSGQWSSWFPSSPSDNVHPHRLGILIKHLSNEPDYHIHPTHPSCPTNGHKNRGHIPASALTTTFRPSETFFLLLPLLLPLYVNQSMELKKKKDQRSDTPFSLAAFGV